MSRSACYSAGFRTCQEHNTEGSKESSHLELMTPILETECKAWTSLSPPAQRCASCPRPPHPLQTISPVSRAPGSIYCPSNTCPTQTETREGHEHSLAHLPACHQQTQTKPFKIPEGQHWDRKRKHRIKTEKFLSLSRHSNLADINAEVQ